MKKIFLSLALLVTPALYAGQNRHEVFTPSPIQICEELYIPANKTLLYNNSYDVDKLIYPTSILKCEQLTGKGIIFVESYNTFVLHAKDMSNFEGKFYCNPFASFIIYTNTKTEDLKCTMFWKPQKPVNQEENYE